MQCLGISYVVNGKPVYCSQPGYEDAPIRKAHHRQRPAERPSASKQKDLAMKISLSPDSVLMLCRRQATNVVNAGPEGKATCCRTDPRDLPVCAPTTSMAAFPFCSALLVKSDVNHLLRWLEQGELCAFAKNLHQSAATVRQPRVEVAKAGVAWGTRMSGGRGRSAQLTWRIAPTATSKRSGPTGLECSMP